eukprot:1191252-Amorphochlora_amoeboformis.AAC.1
MTSHTHRVVVHEGSPQLRIVHVTIPGLLTGEESVQLSMGLGTQKRPWIPVDLDVIFRDPAADDLLLVQYASRILNACLTTLSELIPYNQY